MRVPLILAGYFLLQALLIFFASNGPFTDEAIYITAGHQILDNFSNGDSGFRSTYSLWFQGSPFAWPILASMAYAYGGLLAARLFAAALSTVVLFFLYLAWKKIFDRNTARWSVCLLALNGHFLFVGQLAVYDILALTLASLGFFLTCLYLEKRNYAMLLLAGVVLGCATISKYGYFLSVVPAAGALAARLPIRRAAIETAVLVLVTGIVFLAYWYFVFGHFSTGVIRFYASHDGKPRLEQVVQFSYWLALPLLISSVGIKRAFEAHRSTFFTCIPLLGLIIAAHLMTQAHVSANKHIAFGLAFFYPLVAVGFLRLTSRWSTAFSAGLICLLALFGLAQWQQMTRTWPDSRPVSEFLLKNMKSDHRLAAEDGWVYRLPLYWGGIVQHPMRVWDRWKIDRSKLDLCKLDWIVGSSINGKVDPITKVALDCGFTAVFSSDSELLSGLEAGLNRRSLMTLTIYQKL